MSFEHQNPSDPLASHRDAPGLTRALGRALEPPSDACLDAETLAAWSEGGLTPDAALRVETHLSSCERCQAVAASFAESEPKAAAVVIPFWQRPSIRWIAPLSAAAAAVLIWMVAPFDQPNQPASTEMARVEGQTAPAPPPAAPAPGGLADRVEKPLAKELADDARRLAKNEPAPQESADKSAAARRDEQRQARAGEAQQTMSDRAFAKAPQAAAAPPPPAAAPPPPMPTPPPAVLAEPRAGAAPAPAPAPAEQSTFRMGESVTQTAISPPIVIYVTPNPAVLDRAESALNAAELARAGRGGRVASAPSPPPGPVPMAPPAQMPLPRWRIVDAVRVERTTDGVTWQTATIDSPSTLTGGFAPSPLVCWLVGPNGAVFRAMDGVTFVRATFSEVTDLQSISASSDGQNATVTTANGRQFTTTNGGVSWTRTR